MYVESCSNNLVFIYHFVSSLNCLQIQFMLFPHHLYECMGSFLTRMKNILGWAVCTEMICMQIAQKALTEILNFNLGGLESLKILSVADRKHKVITTAHQL